MKPVFVNELKIIYPEPYTLFQRDSDTKGVIKVRGTFSVGAHPEKLEARFSGGAWQDLNFKPGVNENTFVGTIPVPVGQGLLEVRSVDNPTLNASVKCVGVGDLFLITGQSNADGRGEKMVKLNSPNPYIGVKYRRHVWSKGDDPSANDTDTGSPWPIVLNYLIPDQKVPIGFIAAAVGSTVVRQWRKTDGAIAKNAWAPGGMYSRAMEMVKIATDGSMKIRAVLYYQGENDMTHWNEMSVLGDYLAYKTNLMAVISDFWDDYQAPILVGQITYESDRLKCDNIRQVQQEVWKEHPHALPGPTTYDICEKTGWTGHYTTAAEMKVYADRWTAAILSGIYGQKKMISPELLSLHRRGKNKLVFTYNQPMALKSWDGKTGTKAEGFRFMEGDQMLTNAHVMSTKIKNREVIVEFNCNVSAYLRVNYGSGPDGQGKITIRSAETNLPAPIIFDRHLMSESRGK